MVFETSNKYLLQPKCIGEVSLDKNGNALKDKTANKYYFYERFINQDILYINLRSSQLLYEEKSKEMEINLRKSILNYLKIPGYTLKESLHGAEFYCSSGILMKFAASHIQHKAISVSCIKLEDVIIMIDSNRSEQSQEISKKNIVFSSSETEKDLEENNRIVKNYGCENILKFSAFVKKSSIDGKPMFIDEISAWKQYRRVYVTELKNPDLSSSFRIAYNSIVHCVDEKTNKIVLIKTRPSSIDENDFIWKSNQLSKMFLETILLDCEKIVVGEWDKDSVIHRITIKSPADILTNYKLEEKFLYKNLYLVLKMIKYAFETKENNQVKYVNITKRNVHDKYHVKCYDTIPEDELRIKIFNDF
uniref:Decapping nuclease n=1 Tax=Strongyloides stercoralis TaxID=6248 RepID=A0A0K0DVX6_STRER